MRKASRMILATSCLLGALLMPTTAHAADGVVTAAGLQFVPGVVMLPQGSGLILANADPVAAAFGNGHNLVHDVLSGKKFSSPTVRLGSTAVVAGVSVLAAGDYPMVCTVHPNIMTGTLRIVRS